MYSVPLKRETYEELLRTLDDQAKKFCRLVPEAKYVKVRQGGSTFLVFFTCYEEEPNLKGRTDVQIEDMIEDGSIEGLELVRFESTWNMHNHNGNYHVRFHAKANGTKAMDCLYGMLVGW